MNWYSLPYLFPIWSVWPITSEARGWIDPVSCGQQSSRSPGNWSLNSVQEIPLVQLLVGQFYYWQVVNTQHKVSPQYADPALVYSMYSKLPSVNTGPQTRAHSVLQKESEFPNQILFCHNSKPSGQVKLEKGSRRLGGGVIFQEWGCQRG